MGNFASEGWTPAMQNISRRVFGSLLGSVLTVVTGSRVFAATKPKKPVKKKVAKPARATPSPVPLNNADGSAGPAVAPKDVLLGQSLSANYEDAATHAVKPIVLHRISATTVVAFSAKCTHRGCTVATDKPTSFDCPCHGSSYDSQTGKVLNGPALKALTPLSVEIQNGVLVILPA
jgi:Rieske Fe-S protein